MKRLLLALTLLFAPLAAFAQGPGGLGMSLVQDNATTVTGVRQGNFTCGAVVTSGGTGTGIAQIADGFARQATKTAAFTVPASACGTMYNNIGATGSVTFTLPAAVAGLWYGFTVDAAQTVEVLAVGSDQIAIGASNSSSHNITDGTAYGTVVLYAYKAGQWVAVSSTGTWTVH